MMSCAGAMISLTLLTCNCNTQTIQSNNFGKPGQYGS